jgi:hypothetical protein
MKSGEKKKHDANREAVEQKFSNTHSTALRLWGQAYRIPGFHPRLFIFNPCGIFKYQSGISSKNTNQ